MTKLITDRTQKPYYDYTAIERGKKYISVLGIAGRTLQNREINSISGLLLNHIKNIGDVVLTTGTIISGCSFYADEATNKSYLSEGKIYYNGLVLDTPFAEWITTDIPLGICYVCFELIEQAVTEDDDKLLYDPAENYENYNEPGAYRLYYAINTYIYNEAELKNSQSGSRIIIDIIKLYNRQIISPTKPKPVLGKVYDMMAYRTFDELGNFIVRGLQMKTSMNANTLKQYRITLSEGRAYVKGYEYNYDNNSIITKAAIDEKTSAVDEQQTFDSSHTEYKLFHANVKSINKLQAQVRDEAMRMQRSPSGAINDIVNLDGLIEIKSISQGDTIFEKNTDYIINGQLITWISSNRPSPGTTFYIDVSYVVEFNEGIDYGTISDSDNYTSIQFVKTPEDGTNFRINYTWFIYRYDLIYLDSEGVIQIINGTPGEKYEIDIPEIPIGVLPIGYILVEPGKNPTDYIKIHYNIYRVTVADQRTIMSRVDNIEYNIAMTALENATQSKHTEREGLTSLKGIFVDGFTDYASSDIYHPAYDATIDIFSDTLKMGVSTDIVTGSELTVSGSSTISNKKGIVTLPFTILETDWQKYASNTIDINENGNFLREPILTIPLTYVNAEINTTNFYDENITLPTKLYNSTSMIREWIYGITQGDSYDRVALNNVKINYLKSLNIPEMKTCTITLEGINFTPLAEIKILFDNKQITSFDIITGSAGTTGTGFIKCNNVGYFKITFTTPSEMTHGNKEILAIKATSKTVDGQIVWQDTKEIGSIYFKNIGYYREYERISDIQDSERIRNTFYINAHKQRPIFTDNLTGLSSSRNFDPIAQSFWFTEDMFLDAIDLYFKSKPTLTSNMSNKIYFTIREVINSEPSGPILYEQWINVSDILVSDTAKNATKITFDYPIYCQGNKEYAFTISCANSGYKIWYANVNGVDISSKITIQSKPYKGNVYISKNASSWTLLQDAGLKFSLYTCEFETSANLQTESSAISLTQYSMFNVSVESSVLEGTDLIYSYKIGTADKMGLPLRELITLTENAEYNINMDIIFYMNLSTKNKKISPVINFNTFNAIFGKYKAVGSYIMRSFSFSE